MNLVHSSYKVTITINNINSNHLNSIYQYAQDKTGVTSIQTTFTPYYPNTSLTIICGECVIQYLTTHDDNSSPVSIAQYIKDNFECGYIEVKLIKIHEFGCTIRKSKKTIDNNA